MKKQLCLAFAGVSMLTPFLLGCGVQNRENNIYEKNEYVGETGTMYECSLGLTASLVLYPDATGYIAYSSESSVISGAEVTYTLNDNTISGDIKYFYYPGFEEQLSKGELDTTFTGIFSGSGDARSLKFRGGGSGSDITFDALDGEMATRFIVKEQMNFNYLADHVYVIGAKSNDGKNALPPDRPIVPHFVKNDEESWDLVDILRGYISSKFFYIPSTVTTLYDLYFHEEVKEFELPSTVKRVVGEFWFRDPLEKLCLTQYCESYPNMDFRHCTLPKNAVIIDGAIYLVDKENNPVYLASAISERLITIDQKIGTVEGENGNYQIFGIDTGISNDARLTSVEVENDIATYKFYGDSTGLSVFEYALPKIAQLDVPFNVRHINSYAFSGEASLKTVNMNLYLTEIGQYAFENTGLDELTIASGVQKIEPIGCTNIKSVSVAEGNKWYHAVNNVLFTIDDKTLVYRAPKSRDEAYMPEETKFIMGSAFCNSSFVETNPSLEFDESISVASNAFDKSNIYELTVRSSDFVLFTGEGCFYPNLQILNVPPSSASPVGPFGQFFWDSVGRGGYGFANEFPVLRDINIIGGDDKDSFSTFSVDGVLYERFDNRDNGITENYPDELCYVKLIGREKTFANDVFEIDSRANLLVFEGLLFNRPTKVIVPKSVKYFHRFATVWEVQEYATFHYQGTVSEAKQIEEIYNVMGLDGYKGSKAQITLHCTDGTVDI